VRASIWLTGLVVGVTGFSATRWLLGGSPHSATTPAAGVPRQSAPAAMDRRPQDAAFLRSAVLSEGGDGTHPATAPITVSPFRLLRATAPQEVSATEFVVARHIQPLIKQTEVCYAKDRPPTLAELQVKVHTTATSVEVLSAQLSQAVRGAPVEAAEKACIESILGAPAQLAVGPSDHKTLAGFEGDVDLKIPLGAGTAP
jgi:hypothetical protein